ncbi:MAG: hypothetical protein WC438_05685 [Candidatus Pacearchaeota archaeon]
MSISSMSGALKLSKVERFNRIIDLVIKSEFDKLTPKEKIEMAWIQAVRNANNEKAEILEMI